MKNIFSISLVAALLLLSSCAKKEIPAPNAGKSDKPANPHAGMTMGEQPANPHAGMNMDAPPLTDPNKPMPKDDVHAGLAGMSGMPGMEPPTSREPAVKDGIISVEGLTGKVPSAWTSVPPAVSMRLAQFQVSPASGDSEPGEISVFYIGKSAGGVEANIQRWFGQFSQPDGKPTANVAKREELTVSNLKATIVRFTGTMGASSMPGAPSSGEKTGWMNLSAIVETPNGPIFFKGTGPEKTMKAQEGAVKEFLKGLKFAQ